MVQQGVGLSSQLHTGKVPIQKFPAGEITPAQWIATKLQLKAAMTSQGCKEAWSATPHATNTTSEDHAANEATPADKKKIEQCHATIALLTASFAQNKSLTAIIKRSCAPRWPSGRPWEIYTRLQKRFMRFDKAGRQQRMAAMMAIAMGKNDNPQDIVHLNDTAAPNDPPTSTATICDIYKMKLPLLFSQHKPSLRDGTGECEPIAAELSSS